MMKSLTITVTAIAALALTVLTPVAALAQPTLSLDDAIAMALKHNRTLANAAMQIDKADNDVEIARMKLFPSLKIDAQGSQLLRPVDLTFRKAAFGDFPGIGPVPATDTSITTPARLSFIVNAQAQQPLTQLKKINLNVKLNETTREYNREQLRDAQLTLVDEIRRVYYNIAQTRSALEANTHTLAMLAELDRVVARRVTQQVSLKVDGLTIQSKVAQAELQRLSLAHALDSLKEQLNQLIGRDLRAAFDVTDMPDVRIEEIDLDSAQKRAIDARPDLQQARIKVQQAELARKIARTEIIPDVGLTVSYLSPLNIDGAPTQIATAAIQAQWEPWDWGRRRRTVATRAIEIKQAQNSVHELEERAVLDVNSRFRRLEESRAQLRAARAEQEISRENVRLRVTQYGVQAALLSDVLQTQASLADSDHHYQEALTAFWTARADFERAIGEGISQ